MAKPVLITLPFVFLLLDFWPLQRLSLGASEESLASQGLAVKKTARGKTALPRFLCRVGGAHHDGPKASGRAGVERELPPGHASGQRNGLLRAIHLQDALPRSTRHPLQASGHAPARANHNECSSSHGHHCRRLMPHTPTPPTCFWAGVGFSAP